MKLKGTVHPKIKNTYFSSYQLFYPVTQNNPQTLTSKVYKVNRTGESTVPCFAPVLQTTVSDMQSFSLPYCGLSVR